MTAEPLKISLHNFYEFVWLLKTGIPRMLRILAGTEPFIHDTSILKEGYQHYTRWSLTCDNFKTIKELELDSTMSHSRIESLQVQVRVQCPIPKSNSKVQFQIFTVDLNDQDKLFKISIQNSIQDCDIVESNSSSFLVTPMRKYKYDF